MNTTITSLRTTYLRPNISIETFSVNIMGEQEIHYLINEKGLKYIYCTDLKQLVEYYEGTQEGQCWSVFDSEEDFEEHIEDLNIEWV